MANNYPEELKSSISYEQAVTMRYTSVPITHHVKADNRLTHFQSTNMCIVIYQTLEIIAK